MKAFFIRPLFRRAVSVDDSHSHDPAASYLSPSVYVCFPSWIMASMPVYILPPVRFNIQAFTQCSHVSLLPPRFPPATVPPGRLLRMFWALVVTLVVNVSMINLTPSHPQHGRLSVSTSKMLKCTSKPNLFKQNTPSPTAILRVQLPVQLLICPC
jgi:hypothetical protein